MTAYPHEYDFVKKEGVEFRFLTQPVARARGERTRSRRWNACAWNWATPMRRAAARRDPWPGRNSCYQADQVVKAIGQKKPPLADILGLDDRARALSK